jgi:putative membrane protein
MAYRTFKDYIFLTLKGMGMGAADVVPGVSGGTIAFITEIYEELVESIKSVNPGAVKKVFQEGIRGFWKAINGNFLAAVFLGILISVFTLANVLEHLLQGYPILVWSFFFGLIIASAIYVARKISDWDWKKIAAVLAGIVIAYLITTLTPAKTPNAYWFVFLSGALAICAMILPGISGAFILLLLGKYQFILGSINDLDFLILGVFFVGAVVGLISFSNLLSWLLHRFHNLTIAVLSGFMIGSLNKVWPWKRTLETFTDRHGEVQPLVQKNILPGQFECVTNQESHFILALLAAVAGIILIFAVESLTRSKKKA